MLGRIGVGTHAAECLLVSFLQTGWLDRFASGKSSTSSMEHAHSFPKVMSAAQVEKSNLTGHAAAVKLDDALQLETPWV